MASLKVNYKDDVLSGDRKYRMINNPDGTVSFVDVTDYTQEGDTFGATDINATNTAVNALQEANGDTDISAIGDGTNTGAISAINTHLNGKQDKAWTESNDGTVPATATECRVRGSIYLGGVNQCITLYMNASDLAFNGRYFSGGHDGQTGFLLAVVNTNRTLTVGQFVYAGTIYPSPSVSIEYR